MNSGFDIEKDIIDLMIKHKNEEDFISAYIEHMNNKTDDVSIINKEEDIETTLIKEISRTIDYQIIGKIYWMGRKKYLRLEKMKRLIKN